MSQKSVSLAKLYSSRFCSEQLCHRHPCKRIRSLLNLVEIHEVCDLHWGVPPRIRRRSCGQTHFEPLNGLSDQAPVLTRWCNT